MAQNSLSNRPSRSDVSPPEWGSYGLRLFILKLYTRIHDLTVHMHMLIGVFVDNAYFFLATTSKVLCSWNKEQHQQIQLRAALRKYTCLLVQVTWFLCLQLIIKYFYKNVCACWAIKIRLRACIWWSESTPVANVLRLVLLKGCSKVSLKCYWSSDAPVCLNF